MRKERLQPVVVVVFVLALFGGCLFGSLLSFQVVALDHKVERLSDRLADLEAETESPAQSARRAGMSDPALPLGSPSPQTGAQAAAEEDQASSSASGSARAPSLSGLNQAFGEGVESLSRSLLDVAAKNAIEMNEGMEQRRLEAAAARERAGILTVTGNSVRADDFVITLVGCRRIWNRMVCDFAVTNAYIDSEFHLWGWSRLYDDRGNSLRVADAWVANEAGRLTDDRSRLSAPIVEGVTAPMRVEFVIMSQTMSEIPSIKLRIQRRANQPLTVDFRDVPVGAAPAGAVTPGGGSGVPRAR